MSSWTPSPEGLQELLSCLRSSGSPDTKVQQQTQEVSLASPARAQLGAAC